MIHSQNPSVPNIVPTSVETVLAGGFSVEAGRPIEPVVGRALGEVVVTDALAENREEPEVVEASSETVEHSRDHERIQWIGDVAQNVTSLETGLTKFVRRSEMLGSATAAQQRNVRAIGNILQDQRAVETGQHRRYMNELGNYVSLYDRYTRGRPETVGEVVRGAQGAREAVVDGGPSRTTEKIDTQISVSVQDLATQIEQAVVSNEYPPTSHLSGRLEELNTAIKRGSMPMAESALHDLVSALRRIEAAAAGENAKVRGAGQAVQNTKSHLTTVARRLRDKLIKAGSSS